LKATYYDDNQIFQQYIWRDKLNLDYDIYSFSENQNPQSLERYENNLKEGEQVLFFNQREVTPKTLKYYKSGVKSGPWLYLKRDKDTLSLHKTEKYKRGKLRKTKMHLD
jgi:antitoxin component YwqK of YwqJK toxin-antitoxin module